MNKKGVELPTNALIIILLAVVAGGLVLVFFLGGAGPLTQTIKDWFVGATAGTDRNMAVELCNKYCLDAKSWGDQANSPYCTKSFEIDSDNNGEADYNVDFYKKEDIKLYTQYFCSKINQKELEKVKYGKEDSLEKTAEGKTLGIGCAGVTC